MAYPSSVPHAGAIWGRPGVPDIFNGFRREAAAPDRAPSSTRPPNAAPRVTTAAQQCTYKDRDEVQCTALAVLGMRKNARFCLAHRCSLCKRGKLKNGSNKCSNCWVGSRKGEEDSPSTEDEYDPGQEPAASTKRRYTPRATTDEPAAKRARRTGDAQAETGRERQAVATLLRLLGEGAANMPLVYRQSIAPSVTPTTGAMAQ